MLVKTGIQCPHPAFPRKRGKGIPDFSGMTILGVGGAQF